MLFTLLRVKQAIVQQQNLALTSVRRVLPLGRLKEFIELAHDEKLCLLYRNDQEQERKKKD